MKNLVLTMAIGEKGRNFLTLTLPSMQTYARKIGADFEMITQSTHADPLMVHFEKFQIRRFLYHYRQVLYLDADTVIMPEAPNIFDHVHLTHFAAWNETPLGPRPELIAELRSRYGPVPGWREHFFNAGIFVASRKHVELFHEVVPKNLSVAGSMTNYSDQNYLNWKLHRLKIPFSPLSVMWNWNPICGYIHPAAHFVHFLGSGFFEPERDRISPPQHSTAKRLRQISALLSSLSTGVQPAAPALDLCVTWDGVRSAVTLPDYFLPEGRYEVTFRLAEAIGNRCGEIRCRLFAKKNEEVQIADWRWVADETSVVRAFETLDLAYPQFCFDSEESAQRVRAVEIKWLGASTKVSSPAARVVRRLAAFFGRGVVSA